MKASEFLEHKKVLQTEDSSGIPQQLKDCYTNGFLNCSKILQEASEDVLLSPRSVPLKSKSKVQEIDSFLVCNMCKKSLMSNTMPKWAIANGYFFGTPPRCITDLTEMERALKAL